MHYDLMRFNYYKIVYTSTESDSIAKAIGAVLVDEDASMPAQ